MESNQFSQYPLYHVFGSFIVALYNMIIKLVFHVFPGRLLGTECPRPSPKQRSVPTKLRGSVTGSEFSYLKGKVYVDYAGAPPYSTTLVREAYKALLPSEDDDSDAIPLGNPHSEAGWGNKSTSTAIAQLRSCTLQFLNADSDLYDCILTSGTTAALKLIGESFPWSPESSFCYLIDNHTSVLGIRQQAQHEGASITPVDLSKEHLAFGGKENNVFAYPAESNFTGARYDPTFIQSVLERQGGNWYTLVDAAKACGSQPPNLAYHPAHFVALSYYKMFGVPTGLGALIVRKDTMPMLKKRYYGGGAVAAIAADEVFVVGRNGVESFEDGTLPYQQVYAALAGFSFLQRLGDWRGRVFSLTSAFTRKLENMKHPNGARVAQIYSGGSSTGPYPAGVIGYGHVVTFNLRTATGAYVGYRQVENIAALHSIHLRTGCMCNPGACAAALGMTIDDIRSNYRQGHVCWDGVDVIGDKPTGAIRVSFGYASTDDDVARLLHFIETYFVYAVAEEMPASAEKGDECCVQVSEVWVYPIKACRGMTTDRWHMGEHGLLYDRKWALISPDGSVITLKNCPRLSGITPRIEKNCLIVHSKHMDADLIVPLLAHVPPPFSNGKLGGGGGGGGVRSTLRICGREQVGTNSIPEADRWFQQALQVSCRLVESQTSFANEADVLVVNMASLREVWKRGCTEEPLPVFAQRFRPNIIVEGPGNMRAWSEALWKVLRSDSWTLVPKGECPRCPTVCIDPTTGERGKTSSVLLDLSKVHKKPFFGILMKVESRQDKCDAVVATEMNVITQL